MTLEQATLLLILVTTIGLYITRWLPTEVTSLLAIVAVALTGLLPPEQALSGFASTATITVGAMFVLSGGLLRTGALEAVTIYLARFSRGDPHRLLLLLALTVPVASAFVNNTPIVVMMVPVALALSRQFDVRPSKLLMPISYFSILGGTMTLIGTSTNILIDDLYRQAGGPGFTMFEFTRLGAIYTAVGSLYLILIGYRLLPNRAPLIDLVSHRDKATYVTEIVVDEASNLVGQPTEQAFDRISQQDPGTSPTQERRHRRLRRPPSTRMVTNHEQEDGVELLALSRGELVYRAEETRGQVLQPGDILMVAGSANGLARFLEQQQTRLATVLADSERTPLLDVKQKVVEAVVLPESPFNGRLVSNLALNRLYGIKVMGVQHRGRQRLTGLRNIRLESGDVLLLLGAPDMLQAASEAEKLLLVEGIERSILRVDKYRIALLIMLGVVLLATLSSIPIVVLAVAGAGLMVATQCLRVDEALQSLDASTLLLLAATIPLGIALESTGLIHLAVDGITWLVGDAHPVLFLSLFYLMTSLTTEIISNNAVAVLFTPLALNLAARLGLHPTPLLIAIAFGASAAFLTPIGYQTNAIVMGPGGYRFSDYLRVGLPLSLLMWLTATICIPWFWPLTSSR